MPTIQLPQQQPRQFPWQQAGQAVAGATSPMAGMEKILPLLLQQRQFQQTLAQEKKIAEDRMMEQKFAIKQTRAKMVDDILAAIKADPDNEELILSRYEDFPDAQAQAKKYRKLQLKTEKTAEAKQFEAYTMGKGGIGRLGAIPGMIAGGMQRMPGGQVGLPDIWTDMMKRRAQEEGIQQFGPGQQGLPSAVVGQSTADKWRAKIAEWMGQ